MKTKITAFAIALALTLSGCASMKREYFQGQDAMNKGNYAAAEQLFVHATQGELRDRGAAWNDLGVIYSRTGRTGDAIKAYTMGARYGNTTAAANLRKGGQVVPPADLLGAVMAAKERQDAELLDAISNSGIFEAAGAAAGRAVGRR